MGQSVESLLPEQRAAYYRHMAADALHMARTAMTPDIKGAYIGLASNWKELADSAARMPEWDDALLSIHLDLR